MASKVSYEKWHMDNKGHLIMISFSSIVQRPDKNIYFLTQIGTEWPDCRL
jgi:hypothetical protein